MSERARATLRLPTRLDRLLDDVAAKRDRSKNQQIIRYVRQGLARDGAMPEYAPDEEGGGAT